MITSAYELAIGLTLPLERIRIRPAIVWAYLRRQDASYAAQDSSRSVPVCSSAFSSSSRRSSRARFGRRGAPSKSVRRSSASQSSGLCSENCTLLRMLVAYNDLVNATTNFDSSDVATRRAVSVLSSWKLIFKLLVIISPLLAGPVTGFRQPSNGSVNLARNVGLPMQPRSRTNGQGPEPAAELGMESRIRCSTTSVASFPAASFETSMSPFGRNAIPSGCRKVVASKSAYPVRPPCSLQETIT